MARRVLFIASSAAMAASLLSTAPAFSSDDAERAQLEKSWAEACERFDDQTEWSARRDCNAAWFREHEKAVWQLNLNPHGRAAVAPPPDRPMTARDQADGTWSIRSASP